MAELRRQHRRLTILRLLHEEPGGTMNDSMLQDGLGMFALEVSRDALHVELAWLEEQGLVKMEPVLSSKVVTITGRGEDVALGRARVPGIQRPRAGE
ncbi:ArsR family transcriptional regulator [Gallaecimonas kandeliae]|uniref:VpaChn25_0724 family phage protein n=1 Tax=Gallaecimonas kandeliae TaxID=3029055 RepID=UPI00264A1628|nr:ArsR family transcriptional regulator [Gallaecimonas kandeliae]WKE64349.1 ArsR family transcriptional regulator [Gallaecimonas kandeliae]